MRLCLALGKSLSELRRTTPMPEYAIWRAYELLYAFPLHRVEAGLALAGSAICQVQGGKVKPKDLVPNFEPQQILDYKTGSEMFAAWASAHNARIRPMITT